MSVRPLALLLLAACHLSTYDSSTSATTDTTSGSTGGTSPTTTGSTSFAGTTDGGCPFLDCNTSDAPAAECDIWKEDCPEGQKCMPWANEGGGAWNALKCAPLDPDPDQPGEPCTAEGSGVSGIDSCDKHSMCWNVDLQTGTGECVPMCIGTPDAASCADPLRTCIMANEGVLILCLPQCDPIAQDCPYPPDLCIPNPQDPARFICVLDAGDKSGPLDPCEFLNACEQGLYCAPASAAIECDPMASGCCLPFCDLDDPNTCPGQGQQCIPWYTDPNDAAPFNTDVGACALPTP